MCSDRCLPNNLAKLFSRRSPRGSLENKPCMLVNMADELQNTSQFFCRFTISLHPSDAQVPCPGPYLFHSISMQNQFLHYWQPAVPPYQVPMPHASLSISSVPTYSSQSESTTNKENPQPGATNRNHGSKWTDAETRYLLELWRDNFPISKKRNSTVWDAIAKKLNFIFKDKEIPSYRTATQCEVRIKYLQDECKWVKDHNSWSGNNWELFECYDEIVEVLGSKPNISPKECGFAEDGNATAVGDSEGLCYWHSQWIINNKPRFSILMICVCQRLLWQKALTCSEGIKLCWIKVKRIQSATLRKKTILNHV